MATVLHRTTRELRKSVNTPDYDQAIWIVNPDLSSVAGVEKAYWKIEGDTVSEMSPSEKEVADAARLPEYKKSLMKVIDEETQRRIAAGFEYPSSSGNFYSLSKESQINILGFRSFVAEFMYPYVIRTIDDMEEYVIFDESDAQAFVGAAFAAKETRIAFGRAVKKTVASATNVADAAAIVSAYLAGV